MSHLVTAWLLSVLNVFEAVIEMICSVFVFRIFNETKAIFYYLSRFID